MAATSNRHFFTRAAAAGALAAGALLVVAPAASAAPQKPIKESTIKSECGQAGGEYGTSVVGGVRFSACSYSDNRGNMSIDHYRNGSYTGTDPS